MADLLRHQLRIGLASKSRQTGCVEAKELRRLPISFPQIRHRLLEK